MKRIYLRKFIASSFLLLAFFTSMVVHAKPALTWSQVSLDAEVIKGTVVVKNVSFVSARAIENLSFKIAGSPKLISLIEVVELSSGPAAAGTKVQLALVFNVPTDTPERKFFGTLHVRDSKATIARPLKIRLAVKSGTAEMIPETISIPSADRLYSDSLIDGEYVLGEAIVGFNPGASQEDIKSTIGLLGGVFLGSIPDIGLYQVGFPYANDPALLAKVIEQLSSQPNIGIATHSWITQSRRIPDEGDSLFPPRSWSEPGHNSTAPYKYIGIPDAWDLTVGSSTTNVAIIDLGFDWYHDDLKNNVDFRGGTYAALLTGQTDDDHGTLVAGIIAAEGNNGIGMPGIMWDANLLLFAEKIPYLGDLDIDSLVYAIINAASLAIDKGAKIINYSGGACSANSLTIAYHNSLWKWFLLNKDKAKDVLFVFATGNPAQCDFDSTYHTDQYSSPSGLAKDYENVISVTSIGYDYGLAIPTNELDGFGGAVTIAAPGNWLTPFGDGNGTSFATPVVTGVAGLMLSHNDQLTATQLKQIITESSINPERKVINEDIYIIDAASAVECAERYSSGATSCSTNNPPVANDDILGPFDSEITTLFRAVNWLLPNDYDPDNDPISVVSVSQPNNGVIGFDGDVIDYTPGPGFIGFDTFTYTITDGQGGSDTATVTATVTVTENLVFDYPKYQGVEINNQRATLEQWAIEQGYTFLDVVYECYNPLEIYPNCISWGRDTTYGYNFGTWEAHECSYDGWKWDNCYTRPKQITVVR